MIRDKKYDSNYLALNYHFGDWDNSYRPGGGNFGPFGPLGTPPYAHNNGGPHFDQKKLYTPVYATNQDDELHAGEYGQAFYAGAGDDTLHVATRSGIFYIGGAGIDTIDFSQRAKGVRIALSARNEHEIRLEGVENLIGSQGSDFLRGDDASNVLAGGGGDDVLAGGKGADTLIGGAGRDTVSYMNVSKAVNVDLRGGLAFDGEDGKDLLAGIENVHGSKLNDKIRGDSQQNLFIGGEGNDILNGRGGDDRLLGGEGRDTLLGGVGSDILTGGSGVDTFAFTTLIGTDVVTDFEVGRNGDRLDLNGLLSQMAFRRGGGGDMHHVLRIASVDGESRLQVNADGFAGGTDWQDIFVLENLPGVQLDTLLANGQIIL